LGGFFIWRLNAQDQKKYKGTFGAFCVGTGDSPSFKFDSSRKEWVEMFRDNGQVTAVIMLVTLEDASFLWTGGT
jgi:hypothetical protein